MTIKEKSAGAIIYREDGGKIYYLVLKYGEGHWDYPKGHVESGETDLDAMKREVREETGIVDIAVISGFRRTISYFYKRENELYFKEVLFYLAKTDTSEVRLSHEHQDYAWLEFEAALAKVTFRNAKALMEGANEFLRSYLKA